MNPNAKDPVAVRAADGIRGASLGSWPRKSTTAPSDDKSFLSPSADAVARLACALFGEPNQRLSSGHELRWGRKGSLAVVPAKGVFRDHETGAGGGLIDMIIYAGAAQTRAEAARLLGVGAQFPVRESARELERRQTAATRERTVKIDKAWALWTASEPISGTAAEIYLRECRRVLAPLDHAHLAFLRAAPFHPYQPDCRRLPALIAAVRNREGRFIGCHLSYLRHDGRGKADVFPARKMVGTVKGGHVLLIPGKRVVVAEGLESALSAWEAAIETGRGSTDDLGAVAALSAGGMSAFEWPAGTVALIIAPDRDPAGTGEQAAQDLARRALDRGLSVELFLPPMGCSDWNDAAQMGGAA